MRENKTGRRARRWLAAVLAPMAFASAPAVAESVVLTFNTGELACTATDNGPATLPCATDGQLIGGNYGSTVHLGVSYDASEPNNQSARSSLQFTTDRFFQGNDGQAYVAVPGPASELSRIIFTPAAGYEVSFGSFSWDKLTATTSARFIFEVRDSANALLFSAGNGMLNYTVNTAYYATPLTFLFGNGGQGAVAVDDVAVNVRAAALAPAVPEPAAWALMIVGFGAVGGTLRRHGRRMLVTA